MKPRGASIWEKAIAAHLESEKRDETVQAHVHFLLDPLGDHMEKNGWKSYEALLVAHGLKPGMAFSFRPTSASAGFFILQGKAADITDIVESMEPIRGAHVSICKFFDNPKQLLRWSQA